MTDSSDIHRQAGNKGVASDHRFEPGEILAGKYEIISLIGRGGMSQVFRARQVFLNKMLALKVLDFSGGGLADAQVRRFQVEAKAAFSLNHANLVRVYDFGALATDEYYLAMDLIEGPSLSEFVKAKGPMSPEKAIPLFLQICAGLSYAHQNGIVHRDLKPNNVMLVPKADGSSTPQIVDFGIAKIMGADEGEAQALTKTGEIFGSPLYMSPEQCSGERVDQRSDIYSLGCTFFEVLTGTPPHVGANALRTMMLHQGTEAPLMREASLGGRFSDELEHVIHRMLEKSPDDRYQNLTEVSSDLLELQSGRNKISIKQKTGAQQVLAPKRSLVKPIVLSAFGLMVIGSGAFAVSQFMRHKHEPVEPTAVVAAPVKKERTLVEQVDGVLTLQHKEGLKARKVFANVQKIEAKPVTKFGKLFKRINFPSASIGVVSTHMLPYTPRKDFSVNAVNTKDVPANMDLALEIGGSSSNALKDPSIMTKIDPSLFQQLRISGCHIDLMLDSESVKKAQDANVQEILSDCEQWSTLRSLLLGSVTLNAEMIRSLNNFERISSVSFDSVDGDISNLGKQPFMRKLKYLTLNQFPAARVVDGLDKSSQLQGLSLGKVPDLKTTLNRVSKCGHLKDLSLVDDKIDDSVVSALSSINSLENLTLSNSPLSVQQLKSILKNSPKLYVNLAGTSQDCLKGQAFVSDKLSMVPVSEFMVTPKELMGGGY